MDSSKYILCLLLYGNLYTNVFAQYKISSKNTVEIFEDLPVDNVASRSVLLAGENADKKIKDNIFVKASLNKQHCFPGEGLLLRYELYTALQSTSEIIKQPDLSGFISYPVTVNNETVLYKTVSGKNYRVYSLLAFHIIPYQPGLINIGPLCINNTISYDDKKGDPKNYSGQVSTEALPVLINELPALDKPAFFTGATGNYHISTKVLLADNPAGENNSLFITIEGTGGFMHIDLPAIQWPLGFEHFPGKENTEINYSSFPANGKKTYEIPFIVAEAGEFSIAPVSLAYFDPEKKRYCVVKSESIALHVSPPVIKTVKKAAGIKDGTFINFLIPVVILLVFFVGVLVFSGRKKK